jgi:hypothetical protein
LDNFRYKNPDPELTMRLNELIADGRAAIIGPIRQEFLSGIASPKQFRQRERSLSAFEDIPLETEHFIKAAEFANICRSQGIHGSTIDCNLFGGLFGKSRYFFHGQ